MIVGQISRIAGPVVNARGMEGIKIRDLVRVGELGLVGEVIEVKGAEISIQVYEETDGLKVGEPVKSDGRPFLVELGPGLLGMIYDGIQRPLEIIRDQTGSFIARGATGDPLTKKKRWHFVPTVKAGAPVAFGDVLGWVQETPAIQHKILVPEGIAGTVAKIKEGDYSIEEPMAELHDGTKLHMRQLWPIRRPRPIAQKISAGVPLITGQRIFDVFFPVTKGGSAVVPGPFGSGKTVTQQALAKWADADIVVYIGCGERGNEMTEVLTEFPHLEDPRTGQPLMNRTVLIANTSNMPVAARETSIYTGITIAEYYRDMGYDVALMADSTSRWAEALREISGRLEEMPGEEGYPPYLASRLAEFYERAGRAICLGNHKRQGSVTVIGAVSPPGGDFSEPVTQNSLRIAGAFWGLDARLAYSRHFPAINWLTSYSLYLDALQDWYTQEVGLEFVQMRQELLEILQKEDELKKIVQLVGRESLSEPDKLLLDVARTIRDDFLRQNAYHEVDAYCPLKKQYYMMKAILAFYGTCKVLLGKISYEEMLRLPGWEQLSKMRYTPNEQTESYFPSFIQDLSTMSVTKEAVA
ncbi:V-type ATP synthase subunit A [Candidatus Acetothermia bacterium]|jgi:V/A-type H+-transporting ATPase subunit A|nr:V-type ATP synthase subunit A [Candidatus Acetothermia bacterium]MCI2431040.1 V-type ATP synthase subunit A [Candidatus Acetothermia bacterium]MCI2436936.1 V-type ATP synthase subunit A [Candidatus Acetothermia bacterium]